MVVVGLEHAVVERLAVVGVGARFEQHPGQLGGVRVRRLVGGSALAVAEDAGEQRERGRQAAPQIALGGIGARGEQAPGGGEHRRGLDVGVDARIGEVEERAPAVRTAARDGEPRVRVEHARERAGVVRGGRGPDVGGGEIGVRGQQRARPRPPLRPVVLVGQAGETAEGRRRALGAVVRGRVGVPAVTLE